jgi:uncharacterized phage protein gp47/JayE
MSTAPLLPVIDYTSRDYESIRADLIRLIRARIPFWTADNPSDFGVALVEAFAYGVDGLHYYLDRVANEAYLSTAVQRESLHSIAAMFNYTPRRAVPATAALEFRNATQAEIILPAGTRVQASVPGQSGASLRNFETVEDTILAAGSAIADSTVSDVAALEGRTYRDETVGVSNGFVGQQFFLPRTSVLSDTVIVTTQLGESTLEWTEVPSLQADANPTDRVFEVHQQTDGSSVVRFGDGLHGVIPGLHAVVRATYRVGGGTGGNVPANTINTIIEPVLFGVSVTNPDPATGGLNAESLDSIRINAARTYRARDRAVTQSDYEAVAESGIPEVANAKAVGNNGSSVTVYIAPVDDGTKKPPFTAELDDTVTAYLLSRSMAGVTVQVFGAAFTDIYIEMNVHCFPTAHPDEVEALVSQRLDYVFRYQNVDFDQTVSAQALYSALSGIEGLDYVEITGLNVIPDSGTVSTILMTDIAVNAIPYFLAADTLTATMYGGIGS